MVGGRGYPKRSNLGIDARNRTAGRTGGGVGGGGGGPGPLGEVIRDTRRRIFSYRFQPMRM